MDRIRFTSRLSTDDIKVFLIIYGNMSGCKVKESAKDHTGTRYSIHWRMHKYDLKCSDFSMKLLKINDDDETSIQEVRPDENDWFCFLKRKFGIEYQINYANLFNAKSIIFNKPSYISQISFDEFVILIKNLFNYGKEFNASDLNIIEVESFFQSERRFLISGSNLEKPFYMRISDFQVIYPRAFSYKFRVVMERMFGKDYTEAYSNSFKNIVNPDLSIKEFRPKEAMA